MFSSDIAVKVENLSKCYQIYERPQDRLLQIILREKKQYFREFWALKNISFEIKKGETFGVIGKNGSGKSTLLQILAGTLSQTTGTALVNGRVAALLELGSGFNPEFTGRENILLNGSILGLSKQEVLDRYDQIVEFADIGDFIEQPIKTYSSGMFVRLAFAVQAHIDASVVIIDEALAVGDVFFRQKCYARLEELKRSGSAILLVSHSMPDIEQYCERAILLDRGNLKFHGPSTEATKHYYLMHQIASTTPQSLDLKTSTEPLITGLKIQDHQGLAFNLDSKTFLDIQGKTQITTGDAKCTRIAVLDHNSKPCNSFRQGDKALFYYEFQLEKYIGVPICGMTISTDKGIILYGKNSWQSPVEPSLNYGENAIISCYHNVLLDIAPGEYTFQVGLAAISESDWKAREGISFYEENARIKRICHIPNVGSFSVGLKLRNGIAHLTHHGLTNLEDGIRLSMHPYPY